MPTMSLKSFASWSLAGRWCLVCVDSTHASQTKSRAASTICSSAPWSLRWFAKTRGSGWPRFLCNWTSCLFSEASRLRYFGPCKGTGGGAHPSKGKLGLLFRWQAVGSWSTRTTRLALLGGGKSVSADGNGSVTAGEFSGTLSKADDSWPGNLCDPKMVMVSLLGMLLRTLWRLVRLCQFALPRSWISPVLRWIQMVRRMGEFFGCRCW